MDANNQDLIDKKSLVEIQSKNTPSAMNTTPIDLGQIEVLQILNEHGEADQGLDPNLDAQTLLSLYKAMVLARAFDHRMQIGRASCRERV